MKFVVCGEALIDLMPDGLPSGSPGKWTAYSGGGPFNTATALACLDEQAYFLGRISTDAFGQQLRQHLQSVGVRLDLAVAAEDPTSLAIVSLDEDGRASYTFHFHETSNFSWKKEEFPALRSGDWLHFGSIGSVVGPSAPLILDFVRSTPAYISFDLNVRPSTLPDRENYLRLISDLLGAVGHNFGIAKASDEDIAWLMGDASDPIGYARKWITEYGLSMFIITLGPQGAMAVLPDAGLVEVPGWPVDVVDTVGAGDTFMAGFLSAYASNPTDLEQALLHGTAAAAIVCSRSGAQPPTSAEVDALLLGS